LDILTKATSSIAISLSKSFANNVIERWTRHRAESFFTAFQNHLLENRLKSDINTNLAQDIEKIISTDLGSEVLFDAYRRVSLAKSKDIGPRIIGILTAELCIGGCDADDFEELIFSVAESLNDQELLNMLSTLNDWFYFSKLDKRKGDRSGSVYIEKDELTYVFSHDIIHDTTYSSNAIDLDLSTNDFFEDLGTGFKKLETLGVISTKQLMFNSSNNNNVQMDGNEVTQETLKLVIFPLRYRRILTLIENASSGIEL